MTKFDVQRGVAASDNAREKTIINSASAAASNIINMATGLTSSLMHQNAQKRKQELADQFAQDILAASNQEDGHRNPFLYDDDGNLRTPEDAWQAIDDWGKRWKEENVDGLVWASGMFDSAYDQQIKSLKDQTIASLIIENQKSINDGAENGYENIMSGSLDQALGHTKDILNRNPGMVLDTGDDPMLDDLVLRIQIGADGKPIQSGNPEDAVMLMPDTVRLDENGNPVKSEGNPIMYMDDQRQAPQHPAEESQNTENTEQQKPKDDGRWKELLSSNVPANGQYVSSQETQDSGNVAWQPSVGTGIQTPRFMSDTVAAYVTGIRATLQEQGLNTYEIDKFIDGKKEDIVTRSIANTAAAGYEQYVLNGDMSKEQLITTLTEEAIRDNEGFLGRKYSPDQIGTIRANALQRLNLAISGMEANAAGIFDNKIMPMIRDLEGQGRNLTSTELRNIENQFVDQGYHRKLLNKETRDVLTNVTYNNDYYQSVSDFMRAIDEARRSAPNAEEGRKKAYEIYASASPQTQRALKLQYNDYELYGSYFNISPEDYVYLNRSTVTGAETFETTTALPGDEEYGTIDPSRLQCYMELATLYDGAASKKRTEQLSTKYLEVFKTKFSDEEIASMVEKAKGTNPSANEYTVFSEWFNGMINEGYQVCMRNHDLDVGGGKTVEDILNEARKLDEVQLERELTGFNIVDVSKDPEGAKRYMAIQDELYGLMAEGRFDDLRNRYLYYSTAHLLTAEDDAFFGSITTGNVGESFKFEDGSTLADYISKTTGIPRNSSDIAVITRVAINELMPLFSGQSPDYLNLDKLNGIINTAYHNIATSNWGKEIMAFEHDEDGDIMELIMNNTQDSFVDIFKPGSMNIGAQYTDKLTRSIEFLKANTETYGGMDSLLGNLTEKERKTMLTAIILDVPGVLNADLTKGSSEFIHLENLCNSILAPKGNYEIASIAQAVGYADGMIKVYNAAKEEYPSIDIYLSNDLSYFTDDRGNVYRPKVGPSGEFLDLYIEYPSGERDSKTGNMITDSVSVSTFSEKALKIKSRAINRTLDTEIAKRPMPYNIAALDKSPRQWEIDYSTNMKLNYADSALIATDPEFYEDMRIYEKVTGLRHRWIPDGRGYVSMVFEYFDSDQRTFDKTLTPINANTSEGGHNV